MSHIATTTTIIENLLDAEAATKRLGGELRLEQKKYKWYSGRAKCDHAIHFADAEYEAGLVKQDDGTFRLAYDDYDYKLAKFLGHGNAPLFAQAYGIEAAKRVARLKGYGVKEVARGDGQLELEVMA